ncbi:MAG: nitrate reductase [Pseudomonadota bacterium]
MTSEVKTTCPYCGVGCGIIARRGASGEISVEGDPEHPANFGRLCSKGSALADTIATDRGRLLFPELHGERVSWDSALDHLADEWQRLISMHGPQSVAFYASGQMLTEDYYLANKLMKGYVGYANIDTNSRLCMSSAVSAQKRAFGTDGVACNYSDLEHTDLLVLVGSNLAWCHPVLYQRIKAARLARPAMRVVVIDPRETSTCELADLHLPLALDSDIDLFNGLLVHLADNGATDCSYIASNTEGFDSALASARDSGSLERVAARCNLPVAALATFYRWFGEAERAITAYSMGVNQSRQGSAKAGAIINVHLATGRIGREGCGPFSITGQPNAMGGREVGGLASTLAAHMDFSPDNCDRLQRFWGSPAIAREAGPKALELFAAIERGDIKSVWIMATNPLVSLPQARRWRKALEACELVVVSDCVDDTDTLALADLRLPALGWGEKSGVVTNSERRLSRQRAFLPAPGEARPDWWMIKEVGQRMGFKEGFCFNSEHEVFIEHAALSGFENNGKRAFDISALAALDAEAYDELEPMQWPMTASGPSRLYEKGRFFTNSGRALFSSERNTVQLELEPGCLRLNTGRIRDQWHTLTRTGRAARLSEHQSEPFLSMHPQDARARKLDDGALLALHSDQGNATLRLRLDQGIAPGTVFAPMHWSGSHAANASVNSLLPIALDPDSGEPAYKHNPVHVSTLAVTWYGVLLAREPVTMPALPYWVKVLAQGHYRYVFAASDPSLVATTLAQQLSTGESTLQLEDTEQGEYRLVSFTGKGQLQSVVFLSRTGIDSDLAFLGPYFSRDSLSQAERRWLLSTVPPSGAGSRGRLICSCNNVGESEITGLIAEGCHSVQALTDRCRAGGSCGSCLPELQRIIDGSATTARESAQC